jgi:ABC-type Fe3+/spermidine/putrescine transport system ATPase subunit
MTGSASQLAADFVGDTNLLPGRVVDRDGESVVRVGGAAGFDLPALDRTGEVTVPVRPEDVVVTDADDAGDDGDVAGTVDECYVQAVRTNYVVDPDADFDALSVVVQGRESNVDTGEQVSLSVVNDAAVVF